MGIFNNREIAAIIWIVIILIWCMLKKSIRESIIRIVIQFFDPKILIIYLLSVAYAFIGVYLLFRLGWWNASQLKDTLLWSFFAIMAMLLSITSIKDNKDYFKEAIRENLKFTLITEFILGVYTFNLITEIIIVPIAILIFVMQAFAARDEKYLSVQKFCKWVLMIAGLFMIVYTLYEITINFSEFASLDTLRDFILSPFLGLWILPFIYLLSLYVIYEGSFVMLKFRMKDSDLRRFAKYQALIQFNVDTKTYLRWGSSLSTGSVNTKDEVIRSMKEIKRLQEVEKNPPIVPAELGWSPYEARDFLFAYELKMGYYSNKMDDGWSAISRYKKLGDHLFANDIAYYVYGDEHIAKKLKLVCNITWLDEEQAAKESLLEYSTLLYALAVGKELPSKIKTAILKSKQASLKTEAILITVNRDSWSDAKDKKYTLKFSIEHDR